MAWLAIGTAVVLLGGGWAWAQNPGQEVDRSFRFIERMAQATDLFNADKPQEALDIFRDLAANYPDLDEDGDAAIGIGDCLSLLGLYDQARAAYQGAAAAHPNLQASIVERLADLDLAGEVSDEALARLRADAASGRPVAYWRLGRALQKRAQAMLTEAAKSFRAAETADASGELFPKPSMLTNHTAALEELGKDLGTLIGRTESFWSSLRGVPRKVAEAQAEAKEGIVGLERGKAEYLVRTKDGQRMEIQIRRESDCDEQIVINGKTVQLKPEDQRRIQQYQVRINAILLEAAGQSGEKRIEGSQR